MASIELKGVGKQYGSREVLRGIDLHIEEGEFVSIVGTSGSGKTTLLKLACGLMETEIGSVQIDGKPLQGFANGAAIVFQNYSLLPWLSALENVSLAVESAHADWSKSRVREQAVKYLEKVGLAAAAAKRPGQLSGGMRQRVAIARAFAVEPSLIFLDEPFGALDALTRATLQQELALLCETQQPRATALMITNSVEEAVLLSDRVFALNEGPDKATGSVLGEAISVGLPRPRVAKELARDQAAVRLRTNITDFLIAGRKKKVGVRSPATEPVLSGMMAGGPNAYEHP